MFLVLFILLLLIIVFFTYEPIFEFYAVLFGKPKKGIDVVLVKHQGVVSRLTDGRPLNELPPLPPPLPMKAVQNKVAINFASREELNTLPFKKLDILRIIERRSKTPFRDPEALMFHLRINAKKIKELSALIDFTTFKPQTSARADVENNDFKTIKPSPRLIDG